MLDSIGNDEAVAHLLDVSLVTPESRSRAPRPVMLAIFWERLGAALLLMLVRAIRPGMLSCGHLSWNVKTSA